MSKKEEGFISEVELGNFPVPSAPPAPEASTPIATNKSSRSSSAAAVPQSQSSSPATTIVDEARECLAQSNVMFLYADLRLLSATGRINTKFETLCIDSDLVPRTTASQMAQLQEEIDSRMKEADSPHCEGVSPAQIMAILIVELRKEVLAYRKRVKAQLERENEKGILSSVVGAPDEGDDTGSDSDDDADDAGVMNTVTNAKGRKDFERGMHQMVRAHNDMLYKDMKGMPEVQASKAVWQKHQLKNALKERTTSFAAPFRGVFSNDEGEIDESVTSVSSREQLSWLSSFRYLGTAKEGGGDLEGGEGDSGEGKLPPFKAVAAAKMLLRRPTKAKEDTTVDEKVDGEDQQRQQQQPKGIRTMSSQVVAVESGKRLSGIIEGDEVLLTNASSLTEEKNEEGDDDFRDMDTAGNVKFAYGYGDDVLDGPVRRQKLPGNRRGSALTRQWTTRINQYREDHALYNKGMVGFINTEDYDTFNGAECVGNQLMRMRDSIIASDISPNEMGDSTVDQGRTMSEKELLDYMTKCIESRDPDRLDFMSDFFRENTVSWTMVKSKARIVWLQDWFPIKDPIYGIAVDREKKRVLVVFRGAITRPDWGHSVDSALIQTRNPVKGDYEGKTNTIKLHRGFYRYLLRMRKDTMTRKYDEIANKVYEYGSQMIGEDFTVTVNGYSLGGALSTLFGFYASTDERFTKNGPVKIFTYGAPYTGGHTYGDAFRHQERSRKVQCARFYNHHDVVAHLPINIQITKRGSPFVPLGIDIKLYPAPGQVSCFGCKAPSFRYNEKLPPVKAYLNALKRNCLLNMTWPWKIRSMHGLDELQKRLVMAVQVAKKAEDQNEEPFLHKTLDELYDALLYQK